MLRNLSTKGQIFCGGSVKPQFLLVWFSNFHGFMITPPPSKETADFTEGWRHCSPSPSLSSLAATAITSNKWEASQQKSWLDFRLTKILPTVTAHSHRLLWSDKAHLSFLLGGVMVYLAMSDLVTSHHPPLHAQVPLATIREEQCIFSPLPPDDLCAFRGWRGIQVTALLLTGGSLGFCWAFQSTAWRCINKVSSLGEGRGDSEKKMGEGRIKMRRQVRDRQKRKDGGVKGR